MFLRNHMGSCDCSNPDPVGTKTKRGFVSAETAGKEERRSVIITWFRCERKTSDIYACAHVEIEASCRADTAMPRLRLR